MPAIACPRCQNPFNIPNQFVGRWITCPNCAMQFAAMGDKPIEETVHEYPMQHRSKTPLIILAAAVCAVLVIGMAIWSASGHRAESGRAEPSWVESWRAIAIAPESESQLIDKITQHPFWRVRVTRDMLLKAVDEIRVKPANTLAYLSDRFRLAFVEGGTASSWRPHAVLIPDELGTQRCIRIDLEQFNKRPDPIEILKAMPAKLDRADFEKPN